MKKSLRCWIHVLIFSFVAVCAAVEPETFDHLTLGDPGNADVIIDRKGFAVGFSNAKRQALWVIYKLTAEELGDFGIKRTNRFRPDPEIAASAVPADYAKSGYDRGHLAPAADMAFSLQTMQDSFLMSNMSPQLPGFNRGVWKRLEEQTREFAKAEKQIYVVSGTIFHKDQEVTKIGRNEIPVPSAFFKVIFDLTPPRKMIAFIIPNASSREDLCVFALTVDRVEEMTGLDFFPKLPDDEENRLESELNIELWNWSD